MIPDKIYVGVGTLSSIQPAEEYAFPGWQEKPYSQIRNEEYIRKDALIDWTNKMLQDTAERLDFRSNQAFAELYSKLISM